MQVENHTVRKVCDAYWSNSVNLGVNIIMPITSAVIAAIRTAPADKSFIFFIDSFLSGEIKFAICSMAVLIISKEITKPIDANMKSHSIVLMLKMNPSIITIMDATIWIRAFISPPKPIFNPSIA